MNIRNTNLLIALAFLVTTVSSLVLAETGSSVNRRLTQADCGHADLPGNPCPEAGVSVIWSVYWIARNDEQPTNIIIFGTGPRLNQDAAKAAAAACSHTSPDHIQMIMFSTTNQPWGQADGQSVIDCP